MTHLLHEITAWSYFVVGPVLFMCGSSASFRWMLLQSEIERATSFKLVAVFVWACFLDHYADARHLGHGVLLATAAFEAAISVFTAGFLGLRVILRWRPWRA